MASAVRGAGRGTGAEDLGVSAEDLGPQGPGPEAEAYDGRMTTSRREPKQDRSRETRRKILESAVHCLATYGWQGATMAVVADHVDISRGALQHHFPTREDLMLAAIDHVAEQRDKDRLQYDSTIPEGNDRIDYVVDMLINYYSTDAFKAALQVWVAAATDPALRERVIPLETRFARAAYRHAVEFLRADVSDERTHRLIQSTMDLARGLGLADVITDDSARRNKIAQFWKSELATIKTLD